MPQSYVLHAAGKKDTMSAKHEPELPMDINNTWTIVLTQTFKELQSWPCAALTE